MTRHAMATWARGMTPGELSSRVADALAKAQAAPTEDDVIIGEAAARFHEMIAHRRPAMHPHRYARLYGNEFARGYFCAAAVLLRETGAATTAVRSLFSQGGDPANADPCDIDLFRKHGLITPKEGP